MMIDRCLVNRKSLDTNPKMSGNSCLGIGYRMDACLVILPIPESVLIDERTLVFCLIICANVQKRTVNLIVWVQCSIELQVIYIYHNIPLFVGIGHFFLHLGLCVILSQQTINSFYIVFISVQARYFLMKTVYENVIKGKYSGCLVLYQASF